MIVLKKTHLKALAEKQKEIDDLEAQLNMFVEDVTKLATEAGQKIEAWEHFYQDVLEDVGSVLNMTETLMKHRQLLSDDPDVQNFVRVVAILHDIVKNYVTAYNKSTGKNENEPGTDTEKGTQ